MNELHNRKVINRARKGDLLEFLRGWYLHWAVYVGNKEVVHLAGIDDDGVNGNSNPSHVLSICGKKFNKAVVKRESFWKVVQDSKAKINNDKDRKCRPRPAHQIAEEAFKKIGEIDYNVFWKNCEHFAAFCRYGVNWSVQANKALVVIMLSGAAVMVGGIVMEVSGWKKERN
ncbi:phospholipase A and acyltransferase 2-like [Saccostrea echinata]|uniref:phospholipase A and acyltransferase 2-like n=1 Tax=Saccostrea echinata TaxID=191078 RepID=UPI002A81F67F|nr:phospholipase A and acyltransferase 2-like [Saccostrea echinata]